MLIPAKQVSGRPRASTAALAPATALTLDLAAADVFSVTLTGNTVVSFANVSEGQSGEVYIAQDETGGHRATFVSHVAWKILASGSLDPAASAGAVTRYRYDVVAIDGSVHVALTSAALSEHASVAGILGANLVDYWLAEDAQLVEGAVQAVTGRIGGYTLSAADAAHRPVWTANNANMNGHPSLGGTIADGQRVENTALPAIIPAGSLPFIFSVVSFTDFVSGLDQPFAIVGSAAWVMEARKSYHNLFRAVLYDSGQGQGVVNGPAVAANQTPHIVGGIATNPGIHIWHDGALSTAYFNADPLACDNVTRVSMGGACEIALLGVCLAKPSDTELAALYAYVQAEYGVA